MLKTAMAENRKSSHRRNPLRAMLKLAALIGVLLGLAALLLATIDEAVLAQFKFDLSLGALITVVVVINLISFAGFILLYAAYQWVRRDLKAPRSEDLPDDDSQR